MQRNLQKLKNSITPKAPRCISEIEVVMLDPKVAEKHAYDKLTPRNRFYRGIVDIPGQYGFAVFVSEPVIRMMKAETSPRHLFIDGTFSVRPNGDFQQLLIIHWEFRGHVSAIDKDFQMSLLSIINAICLQCWPIFYVLMSRRTKAAYVALFKYIEENIVKLEPTSVMSDFERALRSAASDVFLGVIIRGCYFHYSQAIVKYVQHLPDLVTAINGDTALERIFYQFLRLPLLPAHKIQEGLDVLKSQAEPFRAFDPLIAYFERQWMRIVSC